MVRQRSHGAAPPNTFVREPKPAAKTNPPPSHPPIPPYLFARSNNPLTDSCALASAPVTAAVVFSALPASAYNSATGKLTTAAVDVLKASLQSAVTKTACSSCSVTIQKVLETDSGRVLFEATARRLQTAGGVTVTFTTTGGSTTQLAAVVSVSSTTAFTAAATTSVASTFPGVTASAPVAVNNPSPFAYGLLGLLALPVLALFFCCFYCKAQVPVPLKTVGPLAPGSSV